MSELHFGLVFQYYCSKWWSVWTVILHVFCGIWWHLIRKHTRNGFIRAENRRLIAAFLYGHNCFIFWQRQSMCAWYIRICYWLTSCGRASRFGLAAWQFMWQV